MTEQKQIVNMKCELQSIISMLSRNATDQQKSTVLTKKHDQQFLTTIWSCAVSVKIAQ